jgi:hypothetical protein
MTTATITDLELLKTRVSGAVGRQMPEHIGRLGWDAGRLAVHQRDRLRALLARAIADSPFHAGRLRGVDPDRFELADLARLPVMTKADMMENFDAATTDRRLTRDLVEQHLARSVTDPSLLFGEYVVLVSGGSSGQRGLFVQTVDEYAEFAASVTRRALAATVAAAGGLPPEGLVIGMVGAGSPVHSSGLACVTATRPPVRLVSAPASLPVAEIVRRLNAAQPPNLLAYAAKLAELAAEQRDGRLRLNLRSVSSFAEAISMPERIAVTEAFGVPVIDLFASTEGLVGHSEPGETVLTFAGDTCIAECADDGGRRGLFQGPGHQPAQPDPADHPLRADRPLHPGRDERRRRAARQRGGAVRRPVPVRGGQRAPVRHRCPAAARPGGAGIPGPADRTGCRHRRGDRRRLRPVRDRRRGHAEPAPGGPAPPAGRFPPGRGAGPRRHDQQGQAVHPPVRPHTMS